MEDIFKSGLLGLALIGTLVLASSNSDKKTFTTVYNTYKIKKAHNLEKENNNIKEDNFITRCNLN